VHHKWITSHLLITSIPSLRLLLYAIMHVSSNFISLFLSSACFYVSLFGGFVFGVYGHCWFDLNERMNIPLKIGDVEQYVQAFNMTALHSNDLGHSRLTVSKNFRLGPTPIARSTWSMHVLLLGAIMYLVHNSILFTFLLLLIFR